MPPRAEDAFDNGYDVPPPKTVAEVSLSLSSVSQVLVELNSLIPWPNLANFYVPNHCLANPCCDVYLQGIALRLVFIQYKYYNHGNLKETLIWNNFAPFVTENRNTNSCSASKYKVFRCKTKYSSKKILPNWSRISSSVVTDGLRKHLFALCSEIILSVYLIKRLFQTSQKRLPE